MENPNDPQTPNTMAYNDSTYLETLQRSFRNLFLNTGSFEIDGGSTAAAAAAAAAAATTPQVQANMATGASSSTGVLPRPAYQDSSNIRSFGRSFMFMNLNNGASYQPYGFSENLSANTLNPSCGFGAPNLYNVNLFDGFSNGNPSLPLSYGFENSNGLGTQQMINGIGSGTNQFIIAAMTEIGSKHLQNLILLKDPRIKNLIFERVIEFIFQLITNQHGRYVFQKLIDLKDEDLLQIIVEKLAGPNGGPGNLIYQASIDRYGSYSIKKLIKVLEKSPLVTAIVKALSDEFEHLMIDPTGRYVIIECLDVLDSQKNDLLYAKAIEKCQKLATDERGCVSMNSFITRIRGPRREQLLNNICNNVEFLAKDPTGNFVVQCVLGLKHPAIVEKICSKLTGCYVTLSMLKQGSHLVEKCLRTSGMEIVVQEFLRSDQLFQVAKDRYGNYVLQTALRETKRTGSQLHQSLVEKLRQHLASLLHGYGRNILTLMTDQLSLI